MTTQASSSLVLPGLSASTDTARANAVRGKRAARHDSGANEAPEAFAGTLLAALDVQQWPQGLARRGGRSGATEPAPTQARTAGHTARAARKNHPPGVEPADSTPARTPRTDPSSRSAPTAAFTPAMASAAHDAHTTLARPAAPSPTADLATAPRVADTASTPNIGAAAPADSTAAPGPAPVAALAGDATSARAAIADADTPSAVATAAPATNATATPPASAATHLAGAAAIPQTVPTDPSTKLAAAQLPARTDAPRTPDGPDARSARTTRSTPAPTGAKPAPTTAAPTSSAAAPAPMNSTSTATPAAPAAQADSLPPSGAAHARPVIAWIATPVTDPDWGQAFSRHLVALAGRSATAGPMAAQFHVDPPELGPVRVSLTLEDGVVHAVFTSPHASVRQTVEQALPQLRQSLEQGGLALGDAQVGQDSGQPRDGPWPSEWAQARPGGAAAAAPRGSDDRLSDTPAAPPAAAPTTREGGIDLYA